MSPTGPSRLGSSIAVLPAPVQPEPVKGTFLLFSKVTFSYCCDRQTPTGSAAHRPERGIPHRRVGAVRSSLKVLPGPLNVALPRQDGSQREVGFVQVWLEPDRLLVLITSTLNLTLRCQQIRKLIVRISKAWIQPQRVPEFCQSLVVCSHYFKKKAISVVGRGVVRVQGDGFLKMILCFRVIVSLPQQVGQIIVSQCKFRLNPNRLAESRLGAGAIPLLQSQQPQKILRLREIRIEISGFA